MREEGKDTVPMSLDGSRQFLKWDEPAARRPGTPALQMKGGAGRARPLPRFLQAFSQGQGTAQLLVPRAEIKAQLALFLLEALPVAPQRPHRSFEICALRAQRSPNRIHSLPSQFHYVEAVEHHFGLRQ